MIPALVSAGAHGSRTALCRLAATGFSKWRHELVVVAGQPSLCRPVLAEYNVIGVVTTSTAIAYTLYTRHVLAVPTKA